MTAATLSNGSWLPTVKRATSGETMDSITLEIGRRLRIRLPFVSEPAYGTLDDVVEGVLVVGVSAPPRRPHAGEGVAIEWGTPRGWYELPAEFEKANPSGFETWWLRPVGPVNLMQRRGFARANVALPILLVDVTDPEEPRTLGASTLDIGEGGVRAAVPKGHGLVANSRIRLHLSSEEVDLEADGHVVRVLPSHEGDEIAICFDQPIPNATNLRRAVMRWQQRERLLRIG
jgi:hypothetical protein